jgi:hypothetical protein
MDYKSGVQFQSTPIKTPTGDVPRSNKTDESRHRHQIRTYSGLAHRRQPIHADMFCEYEDVDGEYWFCKRCERKIPAKFTDGKMPSSICNNPPHPKNGKDIVSGLVPVVPGPRKPGEKVERRHIGVPLFGVGSELKKVLKKIGIELPKNCACNSKLTHLDSFEPEVVSENMRTQIFAWMAKDASERALYFDEQKAEKILEIAIRRAVKAREKFYTETDPDKLI